MNEDKRGPKGGIIGLDDPEERPAPGEARVTLWRCKDCGDLSTRSRSHNHGSVGVRDLKMREPVKFVIASRLERAEEALRESGDKIEHLHHAIHDALKMLDGEAPNGRWAGAARAILRGNLHPEERDG